MASLYTPAYSIFSNGSTNNDRRNGHRGTGFVKVNENEVPESRHTVFIRGLPGYIQLNEIQRFFEDNGYGSVTIEFHKQTEGGAKLAVAVRFVTRDSARDALNRFKEDRVLGHKVDLSWFRDIRKYVSYIREREVVKGSDQRRDERRDHREPPVLRTTDREARFPARKRGPRTPSPVRSNSRSSKRSRLPISRSPIRRHSTYSATREADLEEGETRDETSSLNSVSLAGDEEDRYSPKPLAEIEAEVFASSASVVKNEGRDSGYHSFEPTIAPPSCSPCPPPPPPPVQQVFEKREAVPTPVVAPPVVSVLLPSNSINSIPQSTCTDQLLARLVSTQTRLVDQLQPLEPAPARLQQMQEFRDRRREEILAGLSAQQAHVLNAKARLLEQTHLRDSETYSFVASALLAKDPSLDVSIRFALKEVLEDMKMKFVDELDTYIGANFGH